MYAIESTQIDRIYPRRRLADSWKITTASLDNGVRLILQENPNRNTVVAQCHWRFTHETMLDAEIAHVVEHLLLRRSGSQRQTALHRKLDSTGLITGWVNDLSIGVGADVPRENRGQVLKILRGLIELKSITQEELDNEVRIIASEENEAPLRLASHACNLAYRRAFPRNPASNRCGGFVQNYRRITLDDIWEFCLKNFVPKNLVVGLSGDIVIKQALEQADLLFRNLKGERVESIPQNLTFRKGIHFSLRKSTGMCGVCLMHPITLFSDSLGIANIFTTILSSLWSSPVFNAVRQNGGYGCQTSFDSRENLNFVVINFTAQAKAVKAILRAYIKCLKRLKTKGPSETEVRLALEQIRTLNIVRASNIRGRTMDICQELLLQNTVTNYGSYTKVLRNLSYPSIRKNLKAMLLPQGACLVFHGQTNGLKSDKLLEEFVWS